MHRRLRPLSSVVAILALALTSYSARITDGADKLDPAKATADTKGTILWYDLRMLDVEGQGWTDTKEPYDRLPGKAEGVVRDAVWNLSRDSAGICARFVTNATTIHVKWDLRSDRLAMPHMAATGVSGVDLYVRSPKGWRWLAVGQPKAQANQVPLVANLPAGDREYLLYLPLYNGVKSLEIGVDKSHFMAKAEPRPETHQKPILFYGTSITHGACASRPGMVHTAILGRRFDRPVINLGFSGNGKMEPEVNRLINEIDVAAYVIDCLPNMPASEVAERTVPLVKLLREGHPQTPIVLVEDRTYGDSHLIESKRQRNLQSRVELRKAFESLTANDPHLFYVEGEQLLGDDFEGTVDSSHPNDLGFVRQADAFELVLKKFLPQSHAR